jgi:hypothetical protein
MKKCCRCAVVKTTDQFSKYSKTSDGLQCHCKACQTIANKASYAANREREMARCQLARLANPEKTKATTKKWRMENVERYAAMKKAWRSANLEHTKAQRIANYQANQERDLAAGRAYKAKHKERLTAMQYEKYWADPDAARLQMLAYRAANPGIANAWAMSRVAAKKQAVPEWADLDAIKKIYEAASFMTMTTGTHHEVDHSVPLQSKFVCGLHVAHNLQILTRSENRKKSNRHWPDMP